MSLTLPMEEFVKFHVQARIHSEDGAIAFNVSPSKGGTLFPPVLSGFLVHFKTVVEKGVNVLSISTSFDGEERDSSHSAVHHTSPCSSRTPTSTPHFMGNQAPMHGNFIDIPPLPNYEQTHQEHVRPSDNSVVDNMLEQPDSQLDFSRYAGSIQFSESNAFAPPWYRNQPAMDANLTNMLSGMLLPPNSGTDIVSGGVSEVSHAENQTEYSHAQSSFGGHGFGQSLFPQYAEDEATSPSSAPSYSSPSPSVGSATPDTTPPSQSPVDTPSPGSTGPRKVKPRVPCLRADCDRHFKNDYTRSLHMKSHNIKHPRLFPCRWCALVLSRDHDRMRHEVTKHNIKPQYRCTICRKSFSREKNFTKHTCSASR
ncbi:hypothetical protein C8R47DRAFT_1125056 [Mycena vitilis]|nr:hypothetical protein C8R47DRAFT_1125056 [Mycena vitilis]